MQDNFVGAKSRYENNNIIIGIESENNFGRGGVRSPKFKSLVNDLMLLFASSLEEERYWKSFSRVEYIHDFFKLFKYNIKD